MTDNKPNIIFFFTDQQRWDTCGCYGQTMNTTPNLDKMAAEGVRFEHAFTNQPVCGPARALLQTGLYATETGCYQNHRRLIPDERNLAPVMAAAGYEVGYIGKWHLASGPNERHGLRDNPNFRTEPVPLELRGGYKDYWLASDALEFTSHGYDGHMFDQDGHKREFPEGRFRADAQTDWAIEYLNSRNGEKPFFLFLSYIEPHHQNDHDCYEGPHGSKEKYKDFPVPADLEGTEGDWRENYPDYLGCINALDNGLGRIRATLQELGMAENTLVIFTSDHGSHFRTRNSEYKRTCHENAIRIPMVMHGPGFTGGKVISDMTSLIDLPPTLLAAAGATPPERMHGRPLQSLVNGTSHDWPEDVFVQISESHIGRALRTKRWTYAIAAAKEDHDGQGGSPVYTESYLYDLDTDYHQKNNLVADPTFSEIRAKLAERLNARMIQAGEAVPEIRPATCDTD